MVGLATPWLRPQLFEALRTLAAPETWRGAENRLDDALDFLDDSGAASDPHGRVGTLLHDDAEAASLAAVGEALDAALDQPANRRDTTAVEAAAAEALRVLSDRG